MHERSFAPGQIIAQRYRVERVVGKGGMGLVLAVRHLQLGTLSALKFLLAPGGPSSEFADRFLREARAAASLKGEHVARVNDFGSLEDGTPYLVMELLEGRDLDEELQRRGRIPAREAIGYVRQACRAMMEAHAAGIIHRDLKPHNLFLTRRPDGSPLVKVLDFGISKSGDAASVSQTSSSAVMGSPLYMSPEQVKSLRGVDARGDIYSLGVILYQLVSGRPPFLAESAGELFALILTTPATPLASVAPELSPALGAIVDRCLRKNRDERFSSVIELDAALAHVEASMADAPPRPPHHVGGAAVTAPPPAPGASFNTFAGGANTLPSSTGGKGVGLVVAAGVGGLVLLSLLGGGVLFALRARRSATPLTVASSTPTVGERVIALRIEPKSSLPEEGATLLVDGKPNGAVVTQEAPVVRVTIHPGEPLFDLGARVRVRMPSTCGSVDVGIALPPVSREEAEAKWSMPSAVVDATLVDLSVARVYFDNAGGPASTLSLGTRAVAVPPGGSGLLRAAIGNCPTARTVTAQSKVLGEIDSAGSDDGFVVDMAGGHCYEGRHHSFTGAGILRPEADGGVTTYKGGRIYRTGAIEDFLAPSPKAAPATGKIESRSEVVRCGGGGSSATPAKGGYAVGDAIDVEWKGSWYPARILAIVGNRYRIHYDGYGSNWDEAVLPARMRKR